MSDKPAWRASQRYGGPRSPGARPSRAQSAGPQSAGPQPSPGARPPRSLRAGRSLTAPSLMAMGLYFFPSLLPIGALFSLMTFNLDRFAGFAAAYALYLTAAGLTRAGHDAALAFEAQTVARPPALPRKLLGAAATGLAMAVVATLGGAAMATAAAFGAVAAGLHVLAFGVDPLRSKGLEGLDAPALEQAVTKLAVARRLIAEMVAAADRFGDRALTDRVGALAAEAEAVVAQLERDPSGMARARRFLAVYVVGARDAAVRYAQSWDESRDPEIRARYGALLDDLAAQFAAHRAALASGDRTALEVEIDVLRDRLKLEGV